MLLLSAEEAHLAAQKLCEDLRQKLITTEADRANQSMKMTAEIDDLNRTKGNLGERLIELIRYDLSLSQLRFFMNKEVKGHVLVGCLPPCYVQLLPAL